MSQIGRDLSTSNCLKQVEFQAVSCASGYCIVNLNMANANCLPISNLPALLRFGSEKLSYQCLSANQITSSGVRECATDYCIETVLPSTTDQRCVLLSNDIATNPNRVTKEMSSHKCLAANTLTTNGILQCAAGYCILEGPVGSFQCVALDATAPTQKAGKDGVLQSDGSIGRCLALNSGSAIECATNGQICLDAATTTCKNFNKPLLVGREGVTGLCKPENTASAVFCMKGYCLDTGSQECRALDYTVPARIGQEDVTSKCLPAGSAGTKGAIECADFHCLENAGSLTATCVALTATPSTRVGRDSVNQKCLSAGVAGNGAARCAPKYCVDSSASS